MKAFLMIPYVGISVILILGIILIALLVYLVKSYAKINELYKLDSYTNDFYLGELDKIIETTSIYAIDVKIGILFGSKQGIVTDIPNDELVELQNEIVEKIHNTISPAMREYLIRVLGETWYNSYIRTTAISIVLNYTKYSIESLTAEKFSK